MPKTLYWKAIRLHILVWLLFISWETIITNILYDLGAPTIVYVVHYAITIALFYLQSDRILPWLGQKKWQWLWIPVFCIVFLMMYILAHYLGEICLTHLLDRPIKPWYGLSWASILSNGYRGLFFMGFSTGYYYLRSYILQRNKAQQLETERLKAIIRQQQTQRDLDLMENAFLKAQINPHFLFNILNYIHLHTVKLAPNVSEAVTRLASVMRFAFDIEHAAETVKLGEELKQVEDIIYLYGLKGQKGSINLSYEFAVCNLYMVPLVLLTLAENCFKHGDLSEVDAQMSLTLEDDQLQISTWNKIGSHLPLSSNKTGMQNLAARLKNIYGSNHSFNFGPDNEGGYQVTLQVPLHLTFQPFSNTVKDTDTVALP